MFRNRAPFLIYSKQIVDFLNPENESKLRSLFQHYISISEPMNLTHMKISTFIKMLRNAGVVESLDKEYDFLDSNRGKTTLLNLIWLLTLSLDFKTMTINPYTNSTITPENEIQLTSESNFVPQNQPSPNPSLNSRIRLSSYNKYRGSTSI